jgi:hypothetical protein
MILSLMVLRNINSEATKAHERHDKDSMYSYSKHNSDRLAILLEEVGEVAHEYNELALGNITEYQFQAKAYDELTRVAAMAATWMQAILDEIGDE